MRSFEKIIGLSDYIMLYLCYINKIIIFENNKTYGILISYYDQNLQNISYKLHTFFIHIIFVTYIFLIIYSIVNIIGKFLGFVYKFIDNLILIISFIQNLK